MYLGVAYLDGVGKYFFQKMYGGSLIWKGSAIRHCRVVRSGRKLSRVVGSGLKWSEMFKNGRKWSEVGNYKR